MFGWINRKKNKEIIKDERHHFKAGDWIIKDRNEIQKEILLKLQPTVLGAKEFIRSAEKPYKKNVKVMGDNIRVVQYDIIIKIDGREIEEDSTGYRLATEKEIKEEKLRKLF